MKKCFSRGLKLSLAATLLFWAGGSPGQTSGSLDHPRLYFTRSQLPQLRKMRERGLHRRIWLNLRDSAEECLTLSPRKAWIAPRSPDPNYENLYDRFYAIMRDLAVTEHLAFAYAFSGEARYGEATREWTLASCRAWKPELEGQPDGSKAYAVTRLLKGVAVGYDAAYDRFTPSEREEVRDLLSAIAKKYYDGYFTTPAIAGPGFHTHHATVEWSSFGITALALLNEVPDAKGWLEATVKEFEEHLLPSGLAADGAQVEGATFWASTMQYRIFFMDALRRVTGQDLFLRFQSSMNADLALASIASRGRGGYSQSHQNIILSPPYGQIDYYAPVLLFLAREYRRPICQYLGLWDESLGAIAPSRYVTPHGEKCLFELGGYAFVWADSTVPAKTESEKLSYYFPSVDEAYLRASWKANDLLLGVRKGELVIHSGGQPVLIDPVDWREPLGGVHIQRVEDNGSLASIHCTNASGQTLTIELNRPGRAVVRRRGKADWQWWCQGTPVRNGQEVRWKDKIRLRVVSGMIASWDPTGYTPKLSVGFGKLELADPAPMTFPCCTVHPSQSDEIVIEVKQNLR